MYTINTYGYGTMCILCRFVYENGREREREREKCVI